MLPEDEPFRERFEAYLDGTLDDALREEVERRIAAHPELQAEVELQRRMDQLLRQKFSAPAEIPPLPAPLDTPAATPLPSFWRTRRGVSLLVAAACVGWLLFIWQLVPRGKKQAPFEPQPLAMLFDQAVRSGFEPYWECPPERFAATFQERLQAPLQMTSMPDDRYMAGLAYPGGLSRDTTAILCRVDNQPVMVFVDRLANDRSVSEDAQRPNVQIHRKTLGPLVLYEVSGFDEPQMLGFLKLAERETE
jgi:hypothetical protein